MSRNVNANVNDALEMQCDVELRRYRKALITCADPHTKSTRPRRGCGLLPPWLRL